MPTPEPEYRLIPLTRGLSAKVSPEDFDWLNQWKWRATLYDVGFYATRSEGPQTVLMHREILGLQKGDERTGDHRNHDTLDNRRSNLRVASQREQKYNARMKRTNVSGLKGVYRNKNGFSAKIRIGGKQVYLGYRKTAEEAHALYAEAATRIHGEFVCLSSHDATPR